MKKILLIMGLMIISAITVYSAEVIYSNIFINKFLHCLPSKGSFTYMDANGNNTTVQMGLHGWKDGICRYTETVQTAGNTTTYNCNLAREQVNELVSAMKSDPTGEGIAKQTWNRFKKIPEVCTTSQN